MDVMGLRQSSEQFKRTLQQGNHYRIVRVIHALLRLEGEAFIWVLYSQLLHREPHGHELQYYMQLLAQGTQKLDLLTALIQNGEAERLFGFPNPPGHQDITLASIVNQFFLADGPQFIEALYYEFLYRSPDPGGMQVHLQHLAQGVPRMMFIMSFLTSSEFLTLMAAPLPPGETSVMPNTPVQPVPIAGSGLPAKQVGIFMGYTQTIGKLLDGEGIGRFSMRLIEGLLHHPDIIIHVAVRENNYLDLERAYRKLKALYPGRVFVHKFPSMEWLNHHIPVDVWVVPYIGMELALELHKPFILCVHDLVYMHFRNEYYREQPVFCQSLDNIVYRMADKARKVVFNSNFTRDHEGMQFLKLPFHKMHVIRLAAPSEEYASFGITPELEFRLKYKLYGPYITFPSVVRLHKNHDRLIEAFLRYKQSPDGKRSQLRLVLTDQQHDRPLEGAMAAALQRCTDAEARSSVNFIGRLPSHDIPSLYKYAFGTIVPTLFEGSCPFPILESLVMDTPVATSRLEVINEVVSDHYALITFNPYDVAEMETAIRQLVWNRNPLVLRQKQALQSMLNRKWTDVANEYYAVISAIQMGY
ncbi:hypothetical protein GCM10023310_19420 [Paenibacillus vulneris]|uniref:DUF4214 domain-containing protein n=1 Tax=Paenibacillus vulneris TaxID=1133364 RepID=A0ABW3UPH6_9BACL